MDLTVVIPLFNEKDSLRPLHAEIERALSALGLSYEIVFVDDGSTDGSAEVLREIRQADSSTRVLRLARNSGQTAALACGFQSAQGAVIIAFYVPAPAGH